MYGNPYASSYSLNQQNINERIDNQIAQLQQMKEQIRNNNHPAINQTFQLAPSNSGIRYASTIDEVRKEAVYIDTPFFSKDMSVLWIKNIKGEIKAYELTEIIQKDDKDLQIDYLIAEIDKLKGIIKNEQYTSNDNGENVSTSSSNDNEAIREQTKDDKSASVQRISRSKK